MTDDAPRPRRRAWIGWVVGIVVVLLVLVIGWVGIRGIGATMAVSQAARNVESARALVAGGNVTDLARLASRASAQAENARSLTSDPVWRAAELVPWIGADLRALRETAEIADEAADRARGPLLDAAGEARLGILELSGDQLDVTELARVAPELTRAATVFAPLEARLDDIRPSGAIPPVAAAVRDLVDELTALARGSAMVAGAADLLPTMLAADGARTYLLVVAGEADAAPTAAVIRVTNGTFSLVASDKAIEPLADTGFAEAAQAAAEGWAAAHRMTIDGVVAVDAQLIPALAEVAGLTEEDGTGVAAVYQRLADGSVEPASLFTALIAAGDRGGIQVWSAHEADQERLAQTSLAG